MRKIIQKIFFIILIIVLLYAIYARYIRKDKVVSIFNHSFFVVLTGSMEPTIHSGEFIIIRADNNYNVRRYCYLWRKWCLYYS